MLVRSYKGDLAAVADHLQWPSAKVEAAVNYAEAFPDEIDTALAENDAIGFHGVEAHAAAGHGVRTGRSG